MPLSPAAPATADACLRAALGADVAVARARHGAGLAALILALLARLFARSDTAWDTSPQTTDDLDCPPHGILLPTCGRAPHAACIEAGLVPDWILPGIRNRGMRPAATPARARRRARPVRAPPSLCPALR